MVGAVVIRPRGPHRLPLSLSGKGDGKKNGRRWRGTSLVCFVGNTAAFGKWAEQASSRLDENNKVQCLECVIWVCGVTSGLIMRAWEPIAAVATLPANIMTKCYRIMRVESLAVFPLMCRRLHLYNSSHCSHWTMIWQWQVVDISERLVSSRSDYSAIDWFHAGFYSTIVIHGQQ